MNFRLSEPFQLSGRYADRNRWEVLTEPGDSRVTGLQIIHDENPTHVWTNITALATGASSDIGVDKAKEALGAELLKTG